MRVPCSEANAKLLLPWLYFRARFVVRLCGFCQYVCSGQSIVDMSTKQRQEITRKILESSGTLIQNDHFVYASGDHGSGWVAKDLINLRPELARQLDQLLVSTLGTGRLI